MTFTFIKNNVVRKKIVVLLLCFCVVFVALVPSVVVKGEEQKVVRVG